MLRDVILACQKSGISGIDDFGWRYAYVAMMLGGAALPATVPL
jgi:hypothetical protein